MEDSGFPKLNLSDSQRVEELARIFCKEKRKKIKKPRFFPKKNKSAYIFFTQEVFFRVFFEFPLIFFDFFAFSFDFSPFHLIFPNISLKVQRTIDENKAEYPFELPYEGNRDKMECNDHGRASSFCKTSSKRWVLSVFPPKITIFSLFKIKNDISLRKTGF